MSVCIVTWGGSEIGMGHIYRQISVCEELFKSKIEVTFFVNDNIDVILMLEKNNINYFVYSNVKDINCSQYDIIILDRLDTKVDDIRKLKTNNNKIVSFDDNGDGAFCCDMVINAIVPTKNEYKCLLRGERYICLSESIAKFARKEKTIKNDVKRVLVSFGGSDPQQYTSKIKQLCQDFSCIEFDIVIGPAYQNKEDIIEMYRQESNVRLHNQPSNLAKLIYEADIAIVSGGITLYEVASIGTPSIVIPQVEHQFITANKFEKMGASINFGYFDNVNRLILVLKKTLEKEFRTNMSKSQKLFVGSDGLNNVVDAILALRKGD